VKTHFIVHTVCPICGKPYKYRKEYWMKNQACSRECKDKYQTRQVEERKKSEMCTWR
jgi:hypothetical protein